MAFPWAAVITGGASLATAAMGAMSESSGIRDTNAANAQLARENREWQERMDNTKYQRGVADAKAAGFNPLVAFPGSAGTPMPSTPTMLNPKQNRGEFALNTAKMLADTQLTKEMIKTEITKQELNKANASGSIGLPGVMSVPLATVANGINAVRNLRPDPSSGGKPRNMDAKTFINFLKSGLFGLGS